MDCGSFASAVDIEAELGIRLEGELLPHPPGQPRPSVATKPFTLVSSPTTWTQMWAVGYKGIWLWFYLGGHACVLGSCRRPDVSEDLGHLITTLQPAPPREAPRASAHASTPGWREQGLPSGEDDRVLQLSLYKLDGKTSL